MLFLFPWLLHHISNSILARRAGTVIISLLFNDRKLQPWELRWFRSVPELSSSCWADRPLLSPGWMFFWAHVEYLARSHCLVSLPSENVRHQHDFIHLPPANRTLGGHFFQSWRWIFPCHQDLGWHQSHMVSARVRGLEKIKQAVLSPVLIKILQGRILGITWSNYLRL